MKTEGTALSNKSFWNTVHPFLSNKGTDDNQAIILEENSRVLDEFYINIVEHTTGKKPPVLFHKNVSSAEEEICRLVEKYKDHPIILKIKEKVPPLSHFLSKMQLSLKF